MPRAALAALGWLLVAAWPAQVALGQANAEQPGTVPARGAPARETPPAEAAGDETDEPDPALDAEPESPRAAIAEFLALTSNRRFAEAARFLDVPEADRTRAPELARRLRAVLDRHVRFDLSRISGQPAGDLDDGLPPAQEQVARVPSPRGDLEGVRMIRRAAAGERWLFTRATVRRIDGWYQALELRWLLEHVPEPLLATGPRGLPLWQWLAIAAMLALAAFVGWVMSRITIAVLGPFAARTPTRWDDALLSRIGGPLTVAWMIAIVTGMVPVLGLHRTAEEFVYQLQRGGLFAVFFWTLGRAVEVSGQVLQETPWAREHPATHSLIPLGARVGKLFVLALAVVALLSVLGYPVASLLAGLGIGGLAVALAAQKTVENLFGAFSLGADQPFRVGDFVRVEDIAGTVESIGLRSTRIRTRDRTLVSIPNGKLAEMRLESYSARDRLRLHCLIGLVHETTPAQMRAILTGFERVLHTQPQVWPEGISVALCELSEAALKIEVSAWFVLDDALDFPRVRQDVLLGFMDVIAREGSALAAAARPPPLASAEGERANSDWVRRS